MNTPKLGNNESTTEEAIQATSFLDQYIRPEVKGIFHHVELEFEGINENDEFEFAGQHQTSTLNTELEATAYRGTLMDIAHRFMGSAVVECELPDGEMYNGLDYKECVINMKMKIPKVVVMGKRT